MTLWGQEIVVNENREERSQWLAANNEQVRNIQTGRHNKGRQSVHTAVQQSESINKVATAEPGRNQSHSGGRGAKQEHEGTT